MIEVTDLRITLQGRALVDGVSFTAAPGQTVALVGESGSGKTTTGLALLGELPRGARMDGDVRIGGRWPPPRGAVAYLPQHPSSVLNPVRRIGSVLHELARLHGTSVRTALTDARLPGDEEFLRRFPHQLSGGQQQRLVLAQILLSAPSTLVADEPTTGQDPRTRDELAETLAALPVTTVLLSHDLDLVRGLADHVVVLREGKAVEAGPDVLTRPRGDYARALVEAARPARPSPSPPASGLPFLEVRGLTAAHRRPVLHDVDLSVPRGDRLAVVGRSGSGKTTLARCLAGLHLPRTGTITLDGRVLPARRTRRDLSRIQYVFQDSRATFAPARPVLDQVLRTAVRLRALPPPAARAEALETLAGMGLDERTVRRPSRTLSGGELQRAALARALLARPDVLICDEVTSALDPLTRAEILDLLTGRPLTLLLITHDPAVVARATRVLTLSDGRLDLSGAASHRAPATRVPGP
ncbi:ATP-binding cassette domain-containing protein [Actinocorallia sp. B10E7]|uniref:ABC transporter ATP-binding protein n=1 Tax=Actinocorallia sp. B10E7 TaxID=3153558 RepID=UPI00325CEA44